MGRQLNKERKERGGTEREWVEGKRREREVFIDSLR